MIGPIVRRPVAITMAYVAVALLGVAAWRNVPIELLPDAELPRLNVRAEWPGASPETTEAFLTSPLEAAAQQVRGVEKVTSVSREEFGRGVSEVDVEFARGTDMDFARLDLSERIATLENDLPDGVGPVEVSDWVPDELSEQNSPVLTYTVTGPYTLEALREHVEEKIAPDLRQAEGVGEVFAYGGRERVLEVELDEARTRSLGLGVADVRDRLVELEQVTEAGAVEDDGVLRTVAIRDRPESIAELLAAPVLTSGGRVVRLRDVATVRATFDEARAYYRIDGRPAVQFQVARQVGANTVRMADEVKARVAALEPGLPTGSRLILDDDQSEDIRAQLSDLRFRAFFAAGVIFLVLLAFLGSVTSAAIVFATIAFSILLTINLIYFGGLTLNVLTLMGLAMGFGLIVDNAIVVLENIYRHARGTGSRIEAAERGASEVVMPILAATATTLVVLVPFVYLQGELRVYYVPLAIVVGFGLLASLFVAFTFIPAMAARVTLVGGRAARSGAASGATPGATTEVARRAPVYLRVYRGLVSATLRFPKVTVALAVLIFASSGYLFQRYVNRGVVWGGLGQRETYVDVQIRMPRGEELSRADDLVRHFEARIAGLPDIARYVSRVRPGWGWIRITFPEDVERSDYPLYVQDELTAYSYLFGGTDVRVYGRGPSFYGGGSSPPNYSIKVLGYNYVTVREIAEDLGRRLERFSRIREVDTNASGSFFQRDKAIEVVLALDRGALARHGLTAQDVVREVNAAVRTSERGRPVRIAGDEMQVSVKLAGHETIDNVALLQLVIPSPSGGSVRLTDVASLRERDVLARITRENQQYERRVAYEFRGPAKLGDEITKRVIEATAVPTGYTIESGSDWVWSVGERNQIYGVLLVSILLVFGVTATLFESLRQPFVVLLTVPMALVGVFLIFFYTGASFTREAYVGVIMMGGIVVNNAILLVDHVNQKRRRDGVALAEATLEGTLQRVRPILMTSATTIFGLLPLVLFSEAADANIWNALGYALIGGLGASTLFVLTVTPALYLIVERRAERAAAAAASPPAMPRLAVVESA
ncbi:MAG TPA: efflux RND transporter permease subunit [Longimicrobiales bacterium]|nr:efflux RND transporter permease subunit [Longimicrobiales bacterium]